MSEDNTIDNSEVKEVEYDMDGLRAKAKLMGITFHPSTGGKKLKEKIDLHIKDMELSDVVQETTEGVKSAGPSKTIKDYEKAARKKHLVIITDNNPLDVENPTIVHGVMNSYFKIGPVIIKKDEEQFVPHAIIQALKQKTMIKWVPSINTMTRKPTGNKIAETRNRYNIQFIAE